MSRTITDEKQAIIADLQEKVVETQALQQLEQDERNEERRLEYRMRIGQNLRDFQAALPYGQFITLISKQFHLSLSDAQDYMRGRKQETMLGYGTDIPFHEVATIFPMMGDEEYNALVEDIKAHGLLEPVWIYQGKIIDGRNRYKACQEVGIEPQFREWNGYGSLIDFVVGLNLKRRHLTSSQKAMVALEIERYIAGEARKQQGTRTDFLQIFAKSEPIHAAQQASQLVGTNHTYVTDAKKIVAQAPELKEAVLNGTINIPEAKALAALPKEQRDTHVMRVMGSSESPEWYTPQEIVQLSLKLLGSIDLDPCSNSHETPNVPATTIYTKEDNGLSRTWEGKTYLNPPYGSEIGKWVQKLVTSYREGTVTEAIALLPGRIDTEWFQPLYDFPMCNIRGRLQFSNSLYNAPFPSIVVYLGLRKDDFIQTFGHKGPIMQRIGGVRVW
jgi:hypothetical protein